MTSLGIILLLLHYPKVMRIVKDFTDISRIVFQNHSWNWRIHSPDKELRYHRTVIVTAAVHQILDPRLIRLTAKSLEVVNYWHWAGVSPYTSSFDLAGTCVFVKQSLSVFCCRLCIATESGHLPKVTSSFRCRVP